MKRNKLAFSSQKKQNKLELIMNQNWVSQVVNSLGSMNNTKIGKI